MTLSDDASLERALFLFRLGVEWVMEGLVFESPEARATFVNAVVVHWRAAFAHDLTLPPPRRMDFIYSADTAIRQHLKGAPRPQGMTAFRQVSLQLNTLQLLATTHDRGPRPLASLAVVRA